MDGPLMRKINGKRFLVLLIAFFVLSGSVFALHQFQYKRIGEALRWQSRRAEEQGQTTRSARYLQRYLEFNPRDLDEKANLARMWTSEAYPRNSRVRREAIKFLDEVLRSEENAELRRLLVRTALEQGEFKMAREHLEKLLGWQEVQDWIKEDRALRMRGKPLPEFMAREDRERGELERAWGEVFENDKKSTEAIECYRLAIRHAPQGHPSYVRLGYLLRKQNETDPVKRKNNLDEADKVIDQMVERSPSTYESYLARWRYRRDFDLIPMRETANKGKITLEQASEDVAQALKRQPESVDVLLAAADLERIRGRSAADDPDRTPEQRRTGLREHRKRALEHLERGLALTGRRQTPGDYGEFQLLWHKGNLLLDDLDLQRIQHEEQGQPARADSKLEAEIAALVTQIRKSQMPAAADYVQGRLLINGRKWAEAAALFERARAQLEAQRDLACQANLYLGQCYEKLEEHAQMFNAFKRVHDWDPTSVPAMLGMAAARWAQGQLENAQGQYQVLMKQKRVPVRAWIDIARLEIQRQAQNPKPDWTAAQKILDSAAEYFDPWHLELTLLQAEVFVRQNRSGEARKLLDVAREKKPTETEFWSALVDLALRDKDVRLARRLLDQARARLGDKVNLRLAEARFRSSLEGQKALSKIVELGKDRDRFSEEDQARLLTGLAETLYRAGRRSDARKMWQEMTKLPREKSDLRLQLLLFDLAMKDDDEAGMKQTLADVRQIEQSSGTYHRYGEALFLIWQARKLAPGDERTRLLGMARQQLDQVLTQRASWSPVFLARAEIAELNGNSEQEIKDLQEAIKNGENSPSIIRRLVTRLTQRGRDAEAQFQLGKLREAVIYSSDLGKLAVALEIRRGQTSKALEMMRKAVREDTKDPQDLVWMARVLTAAGPDHAAEAEKRLRAALLNSSSDPAPWLAMCQFLMMQKRKDEAIQLIGQAREKLSADGAALALGRCHDLVGQTKEALACYTEALAKGAKDPTTVRTVASAHLAANRGKEAEPLLRDMVADKVRNLAAADREWARRALAMLLATGTDYLRFKEAMDLVGLKLDESGQLLPDHAIDESTENRRAKARVLASQNQRQFRERAIQLLRELDRVRALTPDDEFVLALLMEAENKIRDSQERLRGLTQPATRTPQYLAQYAMSLVVHRRLPDALDEAARVIGWIEEMEKQRDAGPNAFASVELRARLLEARGKGDEALELLRAHVSRKDARPEEVLLVLGSMGRQKRYKEALALCEKTWKEGKCMPEAVGGVCVSLLRMMDPTDAQLAAVEKHLQAAIDKKPESTVLLMHLSALYDKRGQYDKAAEVYRKVLKREPNNVVALNNLSWLLAHRSGEADRALEYINKAVNGMGRRADLLDTRGMVHLKLKQSTKALQDLKEATAEAPTPARLFHLAQAHHEDRDAARAREALNKAKEKGLQMSSLHPVEQEAARRLLEEYGFRFR